MIVKQLPYPAINLLRNVKQNINNYINLSDKVALNEEIHEELLKCIEMTVKLTYPNAKAYAFGSRATLSAFPDSDIDIFLDCIYDYDEISSHDKSLNQLNSVMKNFIKHRDIWGVIQVISNARVPLIKLLHKPTQIKCDVSFFNGLGVEKSKLIR